jgi:hypothetical protein
MDQKMVDKQIIEGYEALARQDVARACDIWLEAWEGLKEVMEGNSVKDVHEINKKYTWSEFPSNYVQELEMELHNAGLDNAEYFKKRIEYCGELLGYAGEDRLMEENTRRAIADSYFELGDNAECDRLYGQWLKDDPKWGYGYIGWSRNYEYDCPERQDTAKAGMIKEQALAEPEIRDRLDVVDDALMFYEENGGDLAKIDALREEFAMLKAASPGQSTYHKAIPVTSAKAGRNDPCPCGSGKKYKKCHGASE